MSIYTGVYVYMYVLKSREWSGDQKVSSLLSPEENWFGFCIGKMLEYAARTKEETRGNLIRQNTRPCSSYLLVL